MNVFSLYAPYHKPYANIIDIIYCGYGRYGRYSAYNINVIHFFFAQIWSGEE